MSKLHTSHVNQAWLQAPLILALGCWPAAAGLAQAPADLPPPVELSAQEDHARMLALLNIHSLRQGANGRDRTAPNAANYDESKANPYPKLPDPLTLKNGKKISSAEEWWRLRRPEIVEDFDREVYGRVPPHTPKVAWELVQTTRGMVGETPTVVKQLVGHVDNSSYPHVTVDIRLTLTLPAAATGPVPVMTEFTFGGFPPGKGFPGKGGAPAGPQGKLAPGTTAPDQGGKENASKEGKAGGAPANSEGTKAPPVRKGFAGIAGPSGMQLLLARGWGYAALVATSIQADNGAGLTRGIIGLCNRGQPRKPDDWGALRAWAWGASRAMDYFETDPAVDAKRVGISGHSRYGKAALVTLAYDERFAIGYISSSGAGGAKLHRRNFGELVENVAAPNEYHWMAGNYLKYAGPLTWDDLPVDAHELIALCAPRPVFIGAGATEGDGWVDARGMFLAAVGAGPVYRLLGVKDLGTTEFPPIETALIDGHLGFRQHAGGHFPGPNWPTFIEFAERHLRPAR